MSEGGGKTKIRHVDFYPDEYVAGVGGKLSAADQGVYWMVCALIYSDGGPIDDDHVWLSRLFAGTHWRTIRASLDRLIDVGKIERIEGSEGPQITVRRCAQELHKARTRTAQASQNGRRGGRPSRENKDLAKPDGSSPEKLTTNQPTNQPYSESKDSDATASHELPLVDPVKVMFDAGTALLQSAGTAPAAARSLIGRWRKDHGDAAVIDAVGRAQREMPSDPKAWITAALKARDGPKRQQRSPGGGGVLDWDAYNGV